MKQSDKTLVTTLAIAKAGTWFAMAASFLAAIVLIPLGLWGMDYVEKNIPTGDLTYAYWAAFGVGFAVLWLVFGGLTIFISRTIKHMEAEL